MCDKLGRIQMDENLEPEIDVINNTAGCGVRRVVTTPRKWYQLASNLSERRHDVSDPDVVRRMARS